MRVGLSEQTIISLSAGSVEGHVGTRCPRLRTRQQMTSSASQGFHKPRCRFHHHLVRQSSLPHSGRISQTCRDHRKRALPYSRYIVSWLLSSLVKVTTDLDHLLPHCSLFTLRKPRSHWESMESEFFLA